MMKICENLKEGNSNYHEMRENGQEWEKIHFLFG